MAFKRTSFSALKTVKRENFESTYKFSKKVPKFEEGSDVYILPLGLETGYYETPCHRVLTHEVDGQTVGIRPGYAFPVYIRCNGVDSEGNKQESLCCRLAAKERERFKDDFTKRIIGSQSSRVHLPILILGNSLKEEKASYPITKVAILKDLHSEAGLNFSFLELSSSTFKNEIIAAYGKKLKEEGILDYEMDENSDEFFEEIRNRLTQTVIKIHGVVKQGLKMVNKSYSFFPFSSPTIASGSGEEERNAIINYTKNTEIMNKINEFLTLFDVEVDNIIRPVSDKDLQEYYNSAIGIGIKDEEKASGEEQAAEEEKVELVEEKPKEAVKKKKTTLPPVTDEELEDVLNNPFGDEEIEEEKASSEELDDYAEFDMEDDESFFTE